MVTVLGIAALVALVAASVAISKMETKNSPKRAKDEDGKFVADDPKTPTINEAWEGGKAPEPKAKKPRAKKSTTSSKKV